MNTMIKKKIAVFGGTFDPVHIGHYEIVKYLVDNCFVDEVWVLPSYLSPHKDINYISSFKDRVNMLNLMFGSLNNVKINYFEEEYYKLKNDKTYTYEVLDAIKKKYLKFNFSFVIGFDSIKYIRTWHNYKDLLRDNFFYIFDRNDKNINDPNYKQNYIKKLIYDLKIDFDYCIPDYQPTDISSTRIRELFKNYNHNIDVINKYLNKSVIKYILDNKLYGN